MKKIIFIPALFFFLQGQSQVIDTLIGIVNGHPGKLIKDTALSIQTNYITTPSSTSLGFDSSKVGISLIKNATNDSFLLISGSGGVLAKVKDSVGAGGSGTPIGGDHALQYDSLGAFSGNPAFLYADYANKRLGIGTIPSNMIDARTNSNAAQTIYASNSSAGTSAQNVLQFTNGGAASSLLGLTGSGFSSGSFWLSSTLYLQGQNIKRLVIAAFDAGLHPPIIFSGGSGGATENWRIDNVTGNFSNTGAAGTGYINLKAGTTTDAQIHFTSGVAPTTPTSGDSWYETTNSRLMFMQNATSVELMGASAVNTVSPTAPNRTISVTIGGVIYYIAAKTTND